MIPRFRMALATPPVFKLSAPGDDVDTVAAGSLLFDIGVGGYSGVFLSGIVPFTSFALSTVPNFYGFVNYYRYEIPFGLSFASSPKVMVSTNDPMLGAGYYGPGYGPSSISFDSIGGTGFHGCAVGIGAQTYVDKLVLMVSRLYYDGTQWPFPANMSYVVYFT